jgi:hypothetical protein
MGCSAGWLTVGGLAISICAKGSLGAVCGADDIFKMDANAGEVAADHAANVNTAHPMTINRMGKIRRFFVSRDLAGRLFIMSLLLRRLAGIINL